MNVFNRNARLYGAVLIIGFSGFATAQQTFPTKPVRLITPYSPGGSSTIGYSDNLYATWTGAAQAQP